MFFRQLYIQWQQKYLHVHQKALNEKNVYAFLKKKNILMCWLNTEKLLATAKQLIRQKSYGLKNQTIFFTERTCR